MAFLKNYVIIKRYDKKISYDKTICMIKKKKLGPWRKCDKYHIFFRKHDARINVTSIILIIIALLFIFFVRKNIYFALLGLYFFNYLFSLIVRPSLGATT